MTTASIPTTTSIWKLDPSHTTVGFAAKHMMFTTVKGRFADVDGTVTVDGDAPEAASVTVALKAESIETGSAQRDAHLRSADFLDIAAHPSITFRSTAIVGDKASFQITGDLTINGITHPITLEATHEGSGKDPWGGERAGFSASAKFDRRSYGLVWNQVLEAGGVLVGNDVKIEIDAQLVKA